MSTYTPFSVCIITFNEQANLPAALKSVDFADEIIVVDSHSTDATRRIAADFRCRSRAGAEVVPRVVERDWPGHVEQKNFAIDCATHDWVLCIDADERVSPELRREIEAALGSKSALFDAYTMPRRTFYLGRWIKGGGWYPDRKMRLFRRSRGRWGGTNPHDHVYLEGAVAALRGDLLHFTYRDVEHHVRTINFFTDIAAREKLKRDQSASTLRMLLHPPFKFLKMYFLQGGFRDGVVGLIVACFGAYYVFLKYAKLWELRSEQWRKEGGESPSPRLQP